MSDKKPDLATEDETQAAPEPHNRDMTLSHKDAQAGGPGDISIGGEEDPGVGLESLVEENQTEYEPHESANKPHDSREKK